MPAIDALCREHGISAADLGELYLSVGPGSFTGLRIGAATAQLLAQVLQLDVVVVPTMAVVAQNAPADAATNLAVCLNLKGDTLYQGLYHLEGDYWSLRGDPGLATIADLLDTAPRPLAILGDPLGDLPQPLPDGVTVLPAELAEPRARHVWRLGREKAQRQEFADPLKLLPLYVRVPEAEQQWRSRYGDSATIQTRNTNTSKAP